MVTEFSKANLNPQLAGADDGDAFQRFVHEALKADYPELHLFPTSGKDGGIDVSQSVGSSRTVGETKQIGAEDPLPAAQKAWRRVAERLRKHLANPAGPTPGQAQYRPWYSRDPAIREYLFCISARLANEDQRDMLRKEIGGVFHELAKAHAHLAHLEDTSVRVLDWGDFSDIMDGQPHLRFRWFPRSRPLGLTPLEKVLQGGGFREYLTKERLPYFSRREYLLRETTAAAAGFDDEAAMLAKLDHPRVTGLVVTGRGGVGKTRLALELGWLALEQGWTVLLVGQRFRPVALQQLAELVRPGVKVLLVIDYIETQRDFVELANELSDLNSTYGLRLHFLANCRSSYYHVLEGAIAHARVDLSPASDKAEPDWSNHYRRQAVEHILCCGLPAVDERHRTLCQDVAVLAVFLCYLHATGRQPWMEELLVEQDFGNWVANRAKRTLGREDIDQDLALLIAQFPLPQRTMPRLYGEFGELIERLSADGWIVRSFSSGVDLWATLHDVFADRILLSYLQRIGDSVPLFVERAFNFAEQHDSLRSVFTTFQRLADQPVVSVFAWKGILEQRLISRPTAWCVIRDLLVRTSLLDEPSHLDLLGLATPVWESAERETDFQNAIGWVARWACRAEHRSQLTESQQAVLTDWVRKAAGAAERSNFVLTSGLRWCPAEVRGLALAWMLSRPRLFQTHYLVTAWLKRGLPSDEVAAVVAEWLETHPHDSHVSFVVAAWLDAAGRDGLDLVREPIRLWLQTYQASPDAGFVYKSWLDAAGRDGLDLVREPIRLWLQTYQASPDARFVYKSWLDAAGRDGLDLVREPIRLGLQTYQASPDAGFVYRSWLDAAGRDGLDLVREPIRLWLQTYQASPDAGFVYKSWLDAAGRDGLDLVREPIRLWLQTYQASPDARFVYKSWLDAAGRDGLDLVREPIRLWLQTYQASPDAGFVYRSWLDAAGRDGLDLVREPIRLWLQTYQASPDAGFVYKSWLDAAGRDGLDLVREPIRLWLQTYQASPDAGFVYKSWLDAAGRDGLDLVREPIRLWLQKHQASGDADFVYRSWLENHGELALVEVAVVNWLHLNRERYEAVYVTKTLARLKTLQPQTVTDILIWCRTFATDADSLWRVTQLGRHLLGVEVVREVVTTAEALLRVRGASRTLKAPAPMQFNWLCSYLLCGRVMQDGHLRDRIADWFLTWLLHESSFRSPADIRLQRRQFVDRLSELLYAQRLDVEKDRSGLAKFLTWINAWSEENKRLVREQIEELSVAFPAPGLWDLVQFSGL